MSRSPMGSSGIQIMPKYRTWFASVAESTPGHLESGAFEGSYRFLNKVTEVRSEICISIISMEVPNLTNSMCPASGCLWNHVPIRRWDSSRILARKLPIELEALHPNRSPKSGCTSIRMPEQCSLRRPVAQQPYKTGSSNLEEPSLGSPSEALLHPFFAGKV